MERNPGNNKAALVQYYHNCNQRCTGMYYYSVSNYGKRSSFSNRTISFKCSIIMNLFTRRGIFFIPSKLIGWIIFALAVIYSVYTFIDIDSRSHSVSDTLINFVFNLVIIGLVYSMIAFFTSSKETE